MSIGVDIPTPTITCAADTPENVDGHFCVCPVCETQCNVTVTAVPFLDETGVQHGETSDYDLSEYVEHYSSTHLDG